jgi:hypothetical protein
MQHAELEDLKTFLLENTVFQGNGEIYKDTISFNSSGITDRLINQFYIRPITKGNLKYRVSGSDQQIKLITSSFRIVFQLSKKIVDPMKVLVQMVQMNDCIEVKSFNDDTAQVFKVETDKEFYPRDFNLYAIDFELQYETAILDCGCKPCLMIEEC